MKHNSFKNELNAIIKGLGNNGVIFQNEQQFQFDLAWAIKSKLNLDVKFEVVTYGSNKEYTDLVVLNDDGEFIAIELKYKTDAAKIGDVNLQRHSAGDLGCYDFWHDVERVDNLVGKKGENVLRGRVCVGGFVLMITNDGWYWKNERKNTKAQYYNFRLTDNRVVEARHLAWQIPQDKKETFIKQQPKRHHGVDLKRSYKLQWDNYYKDEKNAFKFLMLSIAD